MRPCGIRRLWVIIESQVIEVFFQCRRIAPRGCPGTGRLSKMRKVRPDNKRWDPQTNSD